MESKEGRYRVNAVSLNAAICPICSAGIQTGLSTRVSVNQPLYGVVCNEGHSFDVYVTAERKAEKLALDVDFETARALHRVVRGMHDGECPSCHTLVESHHMRLPRNLADQQIGGFDLKCPGCGFTITAREQELAMKAFAKVMERNLEVFTQWRQEIS